MMAESSALFLIVDPSSGRATQLAKALRRNDHDVVIAKTREQGLDLVRVSVPDVALIRGESFASSGPDLVSMYRSVRGARELRVAITAGAGEAIGRGCFDEERTKWLPDSASSEQCMDVLLSLANPTVAPETLPAGFSAEEVANEFRRTRVSTPPPILRNALALNIDAKSLRTISSVAEEFSMRLVVRSFSSRIGEALNNARADLVLVDLDASLAEAIDAVQRIREEDSLGHTPIIGLSNSPQLGHELMGFENHLDDIIQKPVTTEEIRARFRKGLRVENVGNLDEQIDPRTGFFTRRAFLEHAAVVLARTQTRDENRATVATIKVNFDDAMKKQGLRAARLMSEGVAERLRGEFGAEDLLGCLADGLFAVLRTGEGGPSIESRLEHCLRGIDHIATVVTPEGLPELLVNLATSESKRTRQNLADSIRVVTERDTVLAPGVGPSTKTIN